MLKEEGQESSHPVLLPDPVESRFVTLSWLRKFTYKSRTKIVQSHFTVPLRLSKKQPLTPVTSVSLMISQPRPQGNFKKIALAPHDFAGNLYLI